MVGKGKGVRITCQATSIADDRVPDMAKRETLNLLLLGALSLPTAAMLIPYATFFAPPGLVLPSSIFFFLCYLLSPLISLNNRLLYFYC